jgi:hypothetical protein
MKTLTISILALFFCANAHASTCFFKNGVRDFLVVNPTALTVYTADQEFHLSVFACHNLARSHRISFESATLNDLWVCKGDTLLVLDNMNNSVVIERCMIRDIEERI